MINRLRLDSTADSQKVQDWINSAYTDAVVTTEALQTSSTMALTANTSSYTLPSAVIRIEFMQCSVASTTYPVMIETTLQRLLNLRVQSTPSAVGAPPYYYTLVGENQLEIYPPAAGTETVTIFYSYLPTPLVNAGDVPSLPEPYASNLLIYGALVEGADFSKEMLTGVQGYAQMYQYWLSKLRTHLSRRKGAGVKQFDIVGSGLFTPHDPSTDIR